MRYGIVQLQLHIITHYHECIICITLYGCVSHIHVQHSHEYQLIVCTYVQGYEIVTVSQAVT